MLTNPRKQAGAANPRTSTKANSVHRLLLPVQKVPAREPGGLASFFEVVNAHAASAVGFV